MIGKYRQTLLIFSIALLPALFLILAMWVYHFLLEQMRQGLHEQRATILRNMPLTGASDTSRAFAAAYYVASESSIRTICGEWPENINQNEIDDIFRLYGISAEQGIETSLGSSPPTIVWVIPEESGMRVAAQSKRTFYAKLESLRVLIWTIGLTCAGTLFILFVSLGRKLSDVFLEMEQKNQELERANRNLEELGTLKSNFLTLVSHELRTPLARLTGHMNIITQNKNEFPADLKKRLEDMSIEIEELGRMTSNALDLTRLQSEDLAARLELGQIKKLVMNLVARLQSSVEHRKLKFQVNIPDIPAIPHDPYLLERVLDNLLLNAVKYSPEGSSIVLSIIEEEDKIRIEVESEGRKISELERDKIFEKFYRSSSDISIPGSGLGLYLVRQFILMMGGRAWVEEAEKGNRFVVSLPLP